MEKSHHRSIPKCFEFIIATAFCFGINAAFCFQPTNFFLPADMGRYTYAVNMVEATYPPLLGLVTQLLVGLYSDNYIFPLGHRRFFFLLGGVLFAASSLIIAAVSIYPTFSVQAGHVSDPVFWVLFTINVSPSLLTVSSSSLASGPSAST